MKQERPTTGWVKIYRETLTKDWAKAQDRLWWNEFLLLVQYEPATITRRGVAIRLEPGETAVSRKELAGLWETTEKAVRGWMERMERAGRLALLTPQETAERALKTGEERAKGPVQGPENSVAEVFAGMIEGTAGCETKGSRIRREELAKRIEARGPEWVRGALELMRRAPKDSALGRAWLRLVKHPDGVAVDETGRDRLEGAYRMAEKAAGEAAKETAATAATATAQRIAAIHTMEAELLEAAFPGEIVSPLTQKAAARALSAATSHFETPQGFRPVFERALQTSAFLEGIRATGEVTADALLAFRKEDDPAACA